MQRGINLSTDLFDQLNKNELEQLGRDIQLLPPKSEYIEVKGVGKIDQSISGLIEILNSKGFITLASCSGLKSDHDDKDLNSGYISFDLEKSGQKLNVLIETALSLEFASIEVGDCYFRESLTLRFKGEGESDLKRRWKIFYDDILKMVD